MGSDAGRLSRFDLDGYLRKHFPDLKRSGDERVISCFVCGGRDKLYVNAKKLKYFCFKCGAGRGATILDFIRDHRGVGKSEAFGILRGERTGPPPRPRWASELFERRLPSALEGGLPAAYRPLYPIGELEGSVIAERALAYLRGRGLSDGDLLLYRVGLCLEGPYRFRIIVPVTEAGVSVYFVGRLFFGAGPRYLNAPTRELSVDPSTLMFNFDSAKLGKSIRVAEGVFDAMALGEESVALLGKQLKRGQGRRLALAAWESAEVWLDADARDDAELIGRELEAMKPDARVVIRTLSSGDPSSSPDREAAGTEDVGTLRRYITSRWTTRGAKR